ncbi:polyadenylate-binding protein-interacting protein 1-like [Diadema setosum]|uniref:polyadenylate-binding protein-interacting protein 1-like n=1 Tax=Diadema setosum TaxID=31175 RepID=UPI003B3B3413
MALSAGAVEFVPGKYWNGIQQVEEADHIKDLKEILYRLSISPGAFDECMRSLNEILSAAIREDWQLDEVADIIFEQSVLEPNFTYTGARVIDYLQNWMPIPPGRKSIRTLINQRAKEVVVKREEMAEDPHQQKRLHGVTMFMAELFMNMEIIGNDGITRHKIKVYRVALQELFESLTKYSSPANLKCLGNIFKLAGKTIEDYDREINNTESSELINRIFNDGRDYIVHAKVDRSVREQWLQLIEFRASDWGRTCRKGQRSDDISGADGAMARNGASGDAFESIPVFYGPDGTIITAKEAGYSVDLYPADDYHGRDDYDLHDPNFDAPLNPTFDPAYETQGWQPDFGDETDLNLEEAAAYEQFLLESGLEDDTGLAWGLD